MADVVEFPDLASVVVAFLKAEFTSRGETAKVGTKVPNPMPARVVRVDLASGSERNRITADPVVIVQAYAATEPAAHALCELTRALVRSMPERELTPGATIHSCTGTSTPVPFPDPDISTPRYQATVQLLVGPA